MPQLKALIKASVAEYEGISVDVREMLVTSPLRAIEGAERLSASVATRRPANVARDIPTEGVPLYTDARLYCEAGVTDCHLRRGTAHAARGERTSRR